MQRVALTDEMRYRNEPCQMVHNTRVSVFAEHIDRTPEQEGHMRRLRYQVATSLDGYLAGKDDEFNWIDRDPDIDCHKLLEQFDTALIGGKRFLTLLQQHRCDTLRDLDLVVFSRTLRSVDYPAVSLVSGDPAENVKILKAKPGKDIWLFDGGELFNTLLKAELVDTLETAVVPILLGHGIPMLSSLTSRTELTLRKHRLYPKSGIVLLEHTVSRGR